MIENAQKQPPTIGPGRGCLFALLLYSVLGVQWARLLVPPFVEGLKDLPVLVYFSEGCCFYQVRDKLFDPTLLYLALTTAFMSFAVVKRWWWLAFVAAMPIALLDLLPLGAFNRAIAILSEPFAR